MIQLYCTCIYIVHSFIHDCIGFYRPLNCSTTYIIGPLHSDGSSYNYRTQDAPFYTCVILSHDQTDLLTNLIPYNLLSFNSYIVCMVNLNCWACSWVIQNPEQILKLLLKHVFIVILGHFNKQVVAKMLHSQRNSCNSSTTKHLQCFTNTVAVPITTD